MSAQRIQTYLDKHKIGALFEELMSKLIQDTPEEPIPYLMKTLHKMDAKHKGSPFKDKPKPLSASSASFQRSKRDKELGLSGTPLTLRSLQDESLLKGGRHSAWSDRDTKENGIKDTLPPRPGSAKNRDYSRPWTANSKLNKSKSSSTENLANEAENRRPQGKSSQKTGSRPDWDKTTNVPTHDFDEWFQVKQRGKTEGRDKLSSSFRSQGWSEVEDDPDKALERLTAIQAVNRRRPPVAAGDDGIVDYDEELNKELNIALKMRLEDDSSSTVSGSSTGSSKSKRNSAKHQAEERKRQLQALLATDRATTRPGSSRNEAPGDDSPDEGTELLENSDDLQDEGVRGQKASGSRPSKMSRLAQPAEDTVKVSICARCARVITGQQSTDDQSSDGDTLQPYRSSTRLSTTSHTTTEDYDDDDNFESASQVGEAKMPTSIWPLESEGENSPRKGQHMYRPPQTKPVKGKHMYRDTSIMGNVDSRPSTARTYNLDSDEEGTSQDAKRFWPKNVQFSDDDDTDNGSTGLRTPKSTGRDREKPWNLTARYTEDTESETGSEQLWKSPSSELRNGGWR